MIEFFFPRKLARLQFLWRLLLVNLVTLPLTVDIAMDKITLTGALIFGAALLYSVIFIYLPRCRDASVPAWLLIFAFLPGLDKLLGLLLLLKPGTRRWSSMEVEPPAPGAPPRDA
jgi:hypothetical protein